MPTSSPEAIVTMFVTIGLIPVGFIVFWVVEGARLRRKRETHLRKLDP